MGGTLTQNPGAIKVLNGKGGLDGVMLRYDKTTGSVTSGSVVGGTGNDRIYALWCNTTTRESILGGVFSGTTLLPGAAPRQSAGLFDGFIARLAAPENGLRMADEASEAGALIMSGLEAYPVPFSRLLTIKTNQAVELLDIQGRRMAAGTSVDGSVTLNLPDLRSGIYTIHTADGKVARVVKQ
jgi:hypothetical protein